MNKKEIDVANRFLIENINEQEDVEFENDFFNSGLACEKGITEDDVDPKELEMGIKIEMEHVVGGKFSDDIKKKIAISIALDHLSEIKDYYTRLKKMEQEAKG